MFTLSIPSILEYLRPGEKWCVRGAQTNYESLEWVDETTKPTEQQMLDAELGAAKALRVAKAKQESNERIIAAWPVYKQCNAALGLYSAEYEPEGSVIGATNANPIVIELTAHGCRTGDKVAIAAVGGNTAANVTDNLITVVDANHFSLDGAAGDGAYTSGGTSKRLKSLACINDVKAIRLAEHQAEIDINAVATPAEAVAFTW